MILQFSEHIFTQNATRKLFLYIHDQKFTNDDINLIAASSLAKSGKKTIQGDK